MHTLLSRKNWIFDMDGTLTIAQHDFDAIRRELGLPEGLPILESLDALTLEKSMPLHKKLSRIEWDIAAKSQAGEGATALLDTLLARGANIGILTRNNALNTTVTLKAAGLDHYFSEGNRLSRDCATPKPSPEGIHMLLNQWQGVPQSTVMVGDHLHDLVAGKSAGAFTVYIDPSAVFCDKHHADLCIEKLSDLL